MMERSRSATRKGVYFDLLSFHDSIVKHQTPNTPAVSLFYALDAQLGRIADGGGVEARWAEHQAMAERCWSWVKRNSEERGVALRVLASEGYRTPTVTCIELPEGVRGPDVVAAVKAKGWVIGGGYGKLKDGTIRIGHMGDHTVARLDVLLSVLDGVFAEMGLVSATEGVR
jgi:aspartate aminotransferase-like enzyme